MFPLWDGYSNLASLSPSEKGRILHRLLRANDPYRGFLFSFVLKISFEYFTVLSPAFQWSFSVITSTIIHGRVAACIVGPELCGRFARPENAFGLQTLRCLDILISRSFSILRWTGDTITQYTVLGQISGSTEAVIDLLVRPRNWDMEKHD